MKTNFRFPSGTGCSGRLLHGALHTLAAALLLFAGSACENEDPDVYTPPAPEPLAPLTLVPNMDPRVQNDIEIEEETTGVYRIHTTGEDPYFCTVPFDGNVPADLNVLAFEYQTDRRTDHIQLFFWTEVDGEVIPDVERTIVTTPFEAADTWKEYSVRIRKCREEFFWGEAGNLLRIDFGTVKDADIRLRNLRLREMTDAERAEDAAENENDQNASVYEERLKEYLHASYTSKVDRVEATADKIRIMGSYAGEGSFLLYELPPYADITRIETAYQKYATPLTQSPFDVTLDRMASPEGFPYDRLLSQWAVVCRTAEGDRIVSHGRYADEVAALRNLPPVPMRSKKGLGGFYAGDYTSDLDDLGITSATVNVSPLQFMYLSPAKAGMVEHAYCGETYYFDSEKLDALDATLRETAARDITVAVILLVDPAAEARDAELGALLQHPDYTRGTYTMPNMTTPKAVRAYAAMIDFLAQRYCREDDAYGRIAHWIVHNEVDGGVDWTNMGDDKLITTYTNAYVKSMRLCASIVRQYDANAEFFASFSHSWSRASNPGWYPVRDMVGLLGDFSRAEGDFRWALACHSYPETISDPCTWREPNATFAMNTPFVTLKNLEVLSKWALTPANLFRGTTRRSVWLSEAGTNSPTYAEADLRNQCAGFAYGWKKIAALPGIDGIQWHNWFDHRNEGTLRIGLRRYPDDAEDPGGKKPIWETYRDAGTDREEEAFAPFLRLKRTKNGIGAFEIARTPRCRFLPAERTTAAASVQPDIPIGRIVGDELAAKTGRRDIDHVDARRGPVERIARRSRDNHRNTGHLGQPRDMGVAGEDRTHAVSLHQRGVLRAERFVVGRFVRDPAVGTQNERVMREDEDVIALAVALQLLPEPLQLGAGIGRRTFAVADHRIAVQPDECRTVVGEREAVVTEFVEVLRQGFGPVLGNVVVAGNMEYGDRRIDQSDVLTVGPGLLGVLMVVYQVARHDHEGRFKLVDTCDGRFQIVDRPPPVLPLVAEAQLRIGDLYERERLLLRALFFDHGLRIGRKRPQASRQKQQKQLFHLIRF